jgi:hypothetical protein
VYNTAIKHVKDKCNNVFTKDNISGRIWTFDRHYVVISKILSQSDFGWDWINHKIVIMSGLNMWR